MEKWKFLIVTLLSGSLLSASEGLSDQLLQDYLFTISEDQNACTSPAWFFNDQIYQQNNRGQWMQVGYKVPGNYNSWLQDLADRGVCPKEHRGEYFDRSFHSPGVWYCRGRMPDGQLCPYHIQKQFPNGIPRAD